MILTAVSRRITRQMEEIGIAAANQNHTTFSFYLAKSFVLVSRCRSALQDPLGQLWVRHDLADFGARHWTDTSPAEPVVVLNSHGLEILFVGSTRREVDDLLPGDLAIQLLELLTRARAVVGDGHRLIIRRGVLAAGVVVDVALCHLLLSRLAVQVALVEGFTRKRRSYVVRVAVLFQGGLAEVVDKELVGAWGVEHIRRPFLRKLRKASSL